MSLWTSEFGDQYTRRHRVSPLEVRTQLWRMILPSDCGSILEVGANIGHNLEAISHIHDCVFYATEPNDFARQELGECGLLPETHITADFADKLTWPDNHVDLVFTSGVLIHVPSERLEASLREIYRCSRRWIIAGEYFASSEEMVPYRGHNDILWRRDYGSLYMDMFQDLSCEGCMFTWKRLTGLDNMTWWVLQKGNWKH